MSDDRHPARPEGPRRRRRAPHLLAACIAFAAAMAVHGPAHAYLDPGTGSIILQLLLGGVAGIAFVMKFYWSQFTTLFRGNRKKQDAESASARK